MGKIKEILALSPPEILRAAFSYVGFFSKFSIGNLIIPYEFFKGIHILCQKAKRSGPILKKGEDMSY